MTTWAAAALGLSGEELLFPWQQELLKRFQKGDVPRSLDLPTGMGKTAVMAIWLAAFAQGAPLPRRLVYVVDRRAVVDQATAEAVRLRDVVDRTADFKAALSLARSLPISTLRGQFVDNKEWREDPSSPAIIVGTVDMIGSRLLFEGYGVSRKMRPYHAGLLGSDALVILDEAHLSQPFQKLLEEIADTSGYRREVSGSNPIAPALKLMAMSATGVPAATSFGLQDDDLGNAAVAHRLDAQKVLTIHDIGDSVKLVDKIAQEAWDLSINATEPLRILVYCDKRKDAEAVAKAIQKRSKDVSVELLVGGRRVYERQEAWNGLEEQGFLARSKKRPTRTTFLVATSAGEVGVDLDANHMVGDLVTWERMVQRLGRVNRLGKGAAKIVLFAGSDRAKHNSEEEKRKVAARSVLDHLPEKNGGRDASPRALLALKQRAATDSKVGKLVEAATTPAPLRPALTRPLIEAWSMTSLKEHTGRPDVQPWLRGWEEDPQPQTVVLWRTHLPVRWQDGGIPRISEQAVERFFEAAPPHRSEELETETYRVVEWLMKRAKARPEPSPIIDHDHFDGELRPLLDEQPLAFVLSPAREVRRSYTLYQLRSVEKDALSDVLKGATVVVDARLGGLARGSLDADADDSPATLDGRAEWLRDPVSGGPASGYRVRIVPSDHAPTSERGWKERHRFDRVVTEEGAREVIVVDKWLDNTTTEHDLSAGKPQLLHEHEAATEKRIVELARKLELPSTYVETLRIAARWHDEGKRSDQWQKAFHAAPDGIYAKTRGPINQRVLARYRHEFGSVLRVEDDPAILTLPADLRDLVLHLIVAHHGNARPLIDVRGCDQAPSLLARKQEEIALRFARLERSWGPWGLAWWESLLRAADHQASRENDEAETTLSEAI